MYDRTLSGERVLEVVPKTEDVVRELLYGGGKAFTVGASSGISNYVDEYSKSERSKLRRSTITGISFLNTQVTEGLSSERLGRFAARCSGY